MVAKTSTKKEFTHAQVKYGPSDTSECCATCSMSSLKDGTMHCSIVDDPIHARWRCTKYDRRNGPAIGLSAQTGRLAVTPAPEGKPDGPGLWRVKGMQLPPYFQNVRNALQRAGHSDASAYRITWGAIRRWARGEGNVHPEVRAAARDALRQLAQKSATAHALSLTISEQLELAGAGYEPKFVYGRPNPHYAGSTAPTKPLTSRQAKAKAAFTSYPTVAPQGSPAEEGGESRQAAQLRKEAAQLRIRARKISVAIRLFQRQLNAMAASNQAFLHNLKPGQISAPTRTTVVGGSQPTTPTPPGQTFAGRQNQLTNMIQGLRAQRRSLLTRANALDAQAKRLVAG